MNDIPEKDSNSIDSDGNLIPFRKRIYTAGTLKYSFAGLVMMFFWLLWGDFCFTIMESVFPTLAPLMMKSLGSNSKLIGLVCTTLPSMFNFVITPWVSFKSDRHRSKWGRRIPFLLFPTPFITITLIALGFSREIGAFLHGTIFVHAGISEVTLTLAIVAILAAAFQYFNMFVASVYYYLFNDVVPPELLGRFLSLFRIVGTLAGAAFSYFLVPHAETHQQLIFAGSGIFYLVVFTLMCLKVKEPEYPPPPENLDRKPGMFSSMKTYFVECYSHRFYWWSFTATTLFGMAGCMNVFRILYLRDALGITMAQIGLIGTVSALAGAALGYPAGMYSDKKHPVRTILIALVALLLFTPLQFIFIYRDFSPTVNFQIQFWIQMLIMAISVLYTAANYPLSMRLYPLERYGQYCAGEAMLRALGVMLGGFLAGAFMDYMKGATAHNFVQDTARQANYFYVYVPVWQEVFMLGSFLCMLVVYRYWVAYGGDKNYVPPAVGHIAEQERKEVS